MLADASCFEMYNSTRYSKYNKQLWKSTGCMIDRNCPDICLTGFIGCWWSRSFFFFSLSQSLVQALLILSSYFLKAAKELCLPDSCWHSVPSDSSFGAFCSHDSLSTVVYSPTWIPSRFALTKKKFQISSSKGCGRLAKLRTAVVIIKNVLLFIVCSQQTPFWHIYWCLLYSSTGVQYNANLTTLCYLEEDGFSFDSGSS